MLITPKMDNDNEPPRFDAVGLVDKLAEKLHVLAFYGPQAVQAETERALAAFREVIAKQTGGAWTTEQVNIAAMSVIVSANQKVIDRLRAAVREQGEEPVA